MYRLIVLLLAIPLALSVQAGPITYQGQLQDDGSPANTEVDIVFELYEQDENGSPIASDNHVDVVVTDGLFQVELDFGSGVFDGNERWLEVIVDGQALTPRQPVTATPVALHALNVPAENLEDDFWRHGGNAGTDPVSDYLGTSDAVPLEVRVGGQRGLRMEPADNPDHAPNWMAGHAANEILDSAYGAMIGGGGMAAQPNAVSGNFGVVGGGTDNTAAGTSATVAGGRMNTASGNFTVVAGGQENIAGPALSTVGGGGENVAGGFNATVAGGLRNIASGFESPTIGGGHENEAGDSWATVSGGDTNEAGGSWATVGGGDRNTALGSRGTIGGGRLNNAPGGFSTVGGGDQNSAGYGGTVGGGVLNSAIPNFATVAGGKDNVAGGLSATVGGGEQNSVLADYGTIGGGGGIAFGNDVPNTVAGDWGTVSGGADNHALKQSDTVGGGASNTADGGGSVIGGGSSNLTGGVNSVVPGGMENEALGDLSFAAGRQAKASHVGAFVWADSTPADFTSTGQDQFLIRADGGVGINTNNPDGALDVQGNVRVGEELTFFDDTPQRTAGPIAKGFVSEDGTLQRGVNLESAVWNAASYRYEIELHDESFSYTSYAVAVTPTTDSLPPRVSSVGGKLLIDFGGGPGHTTSFSLVVYKLPSGIETSSSMASAGNADGVESLASSEHGRQAGEIGKNGSLANNASTTAGEALANANARQIVALHEQNRKLQKEVDQLKALAERNAELEDRLAALEALLFEDRQVAESQQ